MQIHKGNDEQTLRLINTAAVAFAEMAEQTAVELWQRSGNKQHAISVTVSALQQATIASIVNMASIYGQEFPKDDRVALATMLQEAVNASIMKIISRIPQQGN